MGNGSGVSRGDRNRDARLERLRVLVPVTNAIVGIDLADVKQMIVVTDHDSNVLAGKTFRCRAGSGRSAGLGAAGQRAWHVIRVRAADADFVGTPQRGPDLRQDR
jgi:transposase